MSYRVGLTGTAVRDLKSIDRKAKRDIEDAIGGLANDPRSDDVKALQGGSQKHYRLRVGDYRVIFTINDKKAEVLVVRVGHRREVYR